MSHLLHHQMRQLARHSEWANQQVYSHCARLDDDAYEQEKSRPSGGVHGLLNHLLVLNKLWQARLQGYDSGIISVDKDLYDDFDSLRNALLAEDVILVDLVRKYSEDQMLYPVSYVGEDGKTHTNSIQEMLSELFLHEAHIRGAIVYALSNHFTTDDMDYIGFLNM